jgi:hypothetical protein
LDSISDNFYEGTKQHTHLSINTLLEVGFCVKGGTTTTYRRVPLVTPIASITQSMIGLVVEFTNLVEIAGIHRLPVGADLVDFCVLKKQTKVQE